MSFMVSGTKIHSTSQVVGRVLEPSKATAYLHEKIEEQTLSGAAASITFQGDYSAYDFLMVRGLAIGDAAAGQVYLKVNDHVPNDCLTNSARVLVAAVAGFQVTAAWFSLSAGRTIASASSYLEVGFVNRASQIKLGRVVWGKTGESVHGTLYNPDTVGTISKLYFYLSAGNYASGTKLILSGMRSG